MEKPTAAEFVFFCECVCVLFNDRMNKKQSRLKQAERCSYNKGTCQIVFFNCLPVQSCGVRRIRFFVLFCVSLGSSLYNLLVRNLRPWTSFWTVFASTWAHSLCAQSRYVRRFFSPASLNCYCEKSVCYSFNHSLNLKSETHIHKSILPWILWLVCTARSFFSPYPLKQVPTHSFDSLYSQYRILLYFQNKLYNYLRSLFLAIHNFFFKASECVVSGCCDMQMEEKKFWPRSNQAGVCVQNLWNKCQTEVEYWSEEKAAGNFFFILRQQQQHQQQQCDYSSIHTQQSRLSRV